MKTPRQGQWPTQQELMEFVDGRLSPERFRDVERFIADSLRLQREVKLLQAMRRTVNETVIHLPGSSITTHVMSEILPHRQEALWMRIIKNSSNLFAMVLVLSMIGIVLVSGPGKGQNENNLFTKTIASYGTAYDAAVQTMKGWTKQYSQPVNQVVSLPFGKFIVIGLGVFLFIVVVDEFLGKRYFHVRIKH